ncbi:MAG TPA: hypothetical protein VEC11_12225 [Allosphingosinicella sp.]|nr:hypothetical protein [Allosphingosinicella sp.]
MTQGWLWGADGAALALVLVAGVADWRRHHRRDIDAHGWMPWRGLQALGFFALLALTTFALRTG